MPAPTLPPLTPPPIPAGRITPAEPKKSSNFFMIMMWTFLIVWSFQLLTRKEPAPPVESTPVEAPSPSEAVAPLPIPSPEDMQQLIAQMPPDVSQSIGQTAAPAFAALGSADPQSPYRMLVTLSNRGAAVTRIELNEKAYRDCADPTGYLGQIVADESLAARQTAEDRRGVEVQTVGHGTPAEAAGLKVGDRIVSIERLGRHTSEASAAVAIAAFDTLRSELLLSRPAEKIRLGVVRAQNAEAADSPVETLEVTLSRAPLSILRPEGTIANYGDYENLAGLSGADRQTERDMERELDTEAAYRRPNADAASFLMTLADDGPKDRLPWPRYFDKDRRTAAPVDPSLDRELSDLAYRDGSWVESEANLRDGYWDFLADESSDSRAVFRKILPGRQLEFRKIYALEPGVEGRKKSRSAPEYHLTLTVSVRNLDTQRPREISYYLDGPTGLPIEGMWYSAGRKTGPEWGTYGLRDLVLGTGGRASHVIKCWDAAMETVRPSDPIDLDYIGVDTQYFQCTLLPEPSALGTWQGEHMPIRVGARLAEHPTFADVSFRLKSPSMTLEAAGSEGAEHSQSYKIFAGPKRQELLNEYGLGETLVYGWFWFVSKPLAAILHFFHDYMVFNYGLAIILLTVLVRLCMFPLSMKQVMSSLKMQKIQPQLNALKEKYKDNPQEMMAAQQALWKKHKINPLGGCLPLFIQFPIFIGLYKTLSLDVNLYGTPLFADGIRWCNNLAAPDMMIDWSAFWNRTGWTSFNLGQGMFSLGPFFNLLPILTIILFLVQQKFLMPPPTGTEAEQAQQRSMRRMMNFMMVFMGFMFFKVPSGLCVYFIASSLWGLLERRFHPKLELTADGELATVSAGTSSTKLATVGGAGSVARQRKNRRQQAARQAEKQGGLRGWWNDLVERAKEQQKLVKAETERRNRQNRKKR